jgi:hypothetical protein
VFPVINGLSDHDAQYLIVYNVFSCKRKTNKFVRRRIITELSFKTFMNMLQSETWENTFNNTDVNVSFNLFFNTYLIIFETCFPMQYVKKVLEYPVGIKCIYM